MSVSQGIHSLSTGESSVDLNQVDVPDEHKSKVIKLLQRNADIFASNDLELGHTDIIKMKIDTGNASPIKQKPYRTQLKNREVIDMAIDQMLEAKIIDRSTSPWIFPVVIVDKKDGSKRFCVDFRALNKVTKRNSYPLPVIDDMLALLDLRSGYWQILMDDLSKEKTAFACHRGLFQFNTMLFGLTNAPAIFQQTMAIVLDGLGKFSVAYLDDILIFSETLEEHLVHIQRVFNRLREHSLQLKLKKCSFIKPETNYLGFVINESGIKPEACKVNVIKALPVPTTVKEVRSFIGMCSYYRRFLPGFSALQSPLLP